MACLLKVMRIIYRAIVLIKLFIKIWESQNLKGSHIESEEKNGNTILFVRNMPKKYLLI